MDNETNTLTFETSTKIDFANLETGAPDTTFQIEFSAPTYKTMQQSARLQQHLVQAFTAAGDKVRESTSAEEIKERAQDADGDDLPPASLITAMLMAHADWPRVLVDFEALATKTGKLNEKSPFTQKHFQSMTPEDIQRLLGVYVRFFIAPSVFSMMLQKS